tara:strand:- start:3373 stop:4017 length:645 start_codon:yes stop_codon:yes gene_type:complete
MRDKEFWNDHYLNFSDYKASSFCTYCLENVIQPNDSIIELGCGNGKDGLKLINSASSYTGLDSSKSALSNFQFMINENGLQKKDVKLNCIDFTSFNFSKQTFKNRLAIYSRFSLHSINNESQKRLFDNIKQIKSSNWICMIEARSIYDDLYGIGENIGEHQFVTDHYRRFIDPSKFLKDILNDFDIQYYELSNGFSKYKEFDPIIIRIIIEKKV